MIQREIIFSRNFIFATLFAATLITTAETAHASLGIDFPSSTSSSSVPYENGGPNTFGQSSGYTVVGWSFSPTVDLYLNRLGLYDADIDRRHAEFHQVGIWSTSNQNTPLASVLIGEYSNIPEKSPQGASFHFADAGNVLLKAGQIYYVGATLSTGTATDFDVFASINGEVPVTINPYIKYLGNAYAINTATNQLVFPSSTYNEAIYTVGANIDVTPTPLPAAAWLFGSGLLGLAGIKRKKNYHNL